MSYREEFVNFLIESGALKFGDFILKSGRKSNYFINAGAFDTGDKIRRLGEYYAACIMDNIGEGSLPEDIAVVFGPAYKGISLAVTTVSSLARDYAMDIGYCFDRKEAKDHGEGGAFVGMAPTDGMKLLLIDDVITAGTAIRNIIPQIKEYAQVDIVGAVVAVDRMDKGPSGELSAAKEIERDLGVKVFSIVTIEELFEVYNRTNRTAQISEELK